MFLAFFAKNKIAEDVTVTCQIQKGESIKMKKKGYRGTRCEKRQLDKCTDRVVKTFSVLESKFADMLQADPSIREFRCNVFLKDFPEGDYCSDFVATKTNGDLMVRECIYRKDITRPRNIRLLDASHEYWLRRGVYDWGIVVDRKKEDGNGKETTGQD